MPTALPMPWPSGPGRDLDARRRDHAVELGMPRRARPPLPELPQVVDRQVVAGRGAAPRTAGCTRARPRARSGRGPASRGSAGSWRRCSRYEHVRDRRERHRGARMPEFAFCTASIARQRMVSIESVSMRPATVLNWPPAGGGYGAFTLARRGWWRAFAGAGSSPRADQQRTMRSRLRSTTPVNCRGTPGGGLQPRMITRTGLPCPVRLNSKPVRRRPGPSTSHQPKPPP